MHIRNAPASGMKDFDMEKDINIHTIIQDIG